MSRPNRLPVLGVALTLEQIETTEGLRDFILGADRDVEIRDLVADGALHGERGREIGARVRQRFEGHRGRIGIHGPYEGLLIDAPDPEVRAIVKARLDRALDALIVMNGGRGGGHMVVHSPYTTWHWYNRGTAFDDCAGILERTHLCLADAVDKAADCGLTIVIENCEDKDPWERVGLAASFGSPAVRVSLDTGHAHYAHGATGAPPVDVFVRAAGAMLAHVHLQDADGFGDRHWAIGRGTIRWASVFAALAGLPEMPRLMLEMAEARDVIASAKWLAAEGLAE